MLARSGVRRRPGRRFPKPARPPAVQLSACCCWRRRRVMRRCHHQQQAHRAADHVADIDRTAARHKGRRKQNGFRHGRHPNRNHPTRQIGRAQALPGHVARPRASRRQRVGASARQRVSDRTALHRAGQLRSAQIRSMGADQTLLHDAPRERPDRTELELRNLAVRSSFGLVRRLIAASA